jgi:hypothetical protein
MVARGEGADFIFEIFADVVATLCSRCDTRTHTVVNIGGHRLTREMLVTVVLHFMASSRSRPPVSLTLLRVCAKGTRHACSMHVIAR